MLNLVRPSYFIPIHGEYRMLVTHGELARKTGVEAENVLSVKTATSSNSPRATATSVGKTYGGNVMVDGSGVGDVGDAVLRDRKHLSADGIMMVVVTIDAEEARVVAGPDLVSRGVFYLPESEGVTLELKSMLARTLDGISAESIRDVAMVKEHIRGSLSKAVYQKTRRRPVVVPVVMEV